MVHARLRQHRVVLDLRLAHGRAVVRDDHELALAAAQALERRLEAERVLARLDDERQPGVDVLLGLSLSGIFFFLKGGVRLVWLCGWRGGGVSEKGEKEAEVFPSFFGGQEQSEKKGRAIRSSRARKLAGGVAFAQSLGILAQVRP